MKKAVVIGGGFAGCTISQLLKEKGFEITLIESLGVLGGGCRTFFHHGHPYTFGPRHLLVNTNEMFVWEYLSKFLNIRRMTHHCYTYVNKDNRFYAFPPHKAQVDEMPDKEKIYDELKRADGTKTANNLEDYWINYTGNTLYEKFVKDYTKKMWQIDDVKMIDEIPALKFEEPIREEFKDTFAGTKVIGYPTEYDGYNSYFDRCAENCNVLYNTKVEKFDLERKRVWVNGQWISGDIIISSASIDSLFDYCHGELKYIGRDFLKIILPIEKMTPEPYYFIYYAGDEPYTRIFEYKLFTGYKSPDTLIGVEFPSFKNKLYPLQMKSEIEKAKKYMADIPTDVYSIGRMGKYNYDNIDDVIRDCLKLIKNI